MLFEGIVPGIAAAGLPLRKEIRDGIIRKI